MKKLVSPLIISLFSLGLLASIPANAEEASGTCNIRPSDLLASFAFSATGTSTNALAVPVGTFSQVGTATGTAATDSGDKITGRWTVTITQNDSTGKVTTATHVGSYTVSTSTCSGDFSWDNVGVVFHATFVNFAKEFKSISTLTGVYIAYDGRKL